MGRLMQKYPDDPEVAIFYALALNEKRCKRGIPALCTSYSHL
jgi:hypothetical protein